MRDVSLNLLAASLPTKAFWQFQSQGLALFLTDGLFRSYRLPIAFDDLLVVSGRFHLKPLLSLLGDDIDYYLVALSQGKVRLFQGSRFGLGEVNRAGSSARNRTGGQPGPERGVPAVPRTRRRRSGA